VSGSPLPIEFYARDTESVARAVLGCVLQTRVDGQRTTGRIVEVEAYLGPDDPAAHGYRNRRTGGNAALYGPPGTSYVYRSYGVHWCFNAVTEREDLPSAVLVRALQPLEGLEAMARRRGMDDPRLLCAGPGRLCQALGITGEHDGHSLATGPIRVLRSKIGAPVAVAVGPRIGITKATDWPLRFVEQGSPWLSRRGPSS
jgi:DNA-3-methyladenine glycosylase